MLAALERGVKGGKWFSLMDKVYARENLVAAARKVIANRGGPGVDRVTVKVFEEHLDANVERLHEELRRGSYEPMPIKRTYIPKAGSKELRPLGIPTVRDRVVQAALRNVLEPIFEREFAEHSYGFRPERGCKDALREVARWLDEGRLWVVDADLKSYFDTIPHDRLMALVGQPVADGKVLALVAAYLRQRVLEEGREWSPETGSPQGAVLSPLLANVYLDPLDKQMEQGGYRMARYADDFVVLCRDEAEAQRALDAIRQWVGQAGLTLHPTKTRLVNLGRVGEGFDFLGYHFERTRKGNLRRWPRKKSVAKFKEGVREHTRRNNGNSLAVIIGRLNRLLRGFFEYFKQSTACTFDGLDGWVRMRLRSILRRRCHRRGRGRGRDHNRWTNAFFGEAGLLSMSGARAQLAQPHHG
jgi:RNA-directed DNA polymerase